MVGVKKKTKTTKMKAFVTSTRDGGGVYVTLINVGGGEFLCAYDWVGKTRHPQDARPIDRLRSSTCVVCHTQIVSQKFATEQRGRAIPEISAA
jgi:hypothetical protein